MNKEAILEVYRGFIPFFENMPWIKNSPNLLKEIPNILNTLVAIVNINRDFRKEMKDLMEKNNIDIDLYIDILCIMTPDAWKLFVKDRFQTLPTSKLIKTMSGKVKMNPEELIGMIALFSLNYDQDKYIKKFFLKYFSMVNEKEIDNVLRYLIQEVELVPNFQKKINKEQIKEDPEKGPSKELANKGNMNLSDIDNENLKTLILFCKFKGMKNSSSNSSEIKRICSIMAEAFDLDLKYLENLTFLLLNESFNKCSESIFAFLKDPRFNVAKESVNQIISLIQQQNRIVTPEFFFDMIESFVPEDLKPYKEFVCKIFFPLVNSDIENSDLSLLGVVVKVNF